MAYDPEYHRQYYQTNKVRKRENAKRWADANPDKVKDQQHRKRLRHILEGRSKRHTKAWETRNKERQLLKAARLRAVKKGWDFDLQLDDIQIPTHCPLLGIKIRRDVIGRMKPDSPSLDRIDTTKGYTKDNVWVISWAANRIKTDTTLALLDKFSTNWLNIREKRAAARRVDPA